MKGEKDNWISRDIKNGDLYGDFHLGLRQVDLVPNQGRFSKKFFVRDYQPKDPAERGEHYFWMNPRSGVYQGKYLVLRIKILEAPLVEDSCNLQSWGYRLEVEFIHQPPYTIYRGEIWFYPFRKKHRFEPEVIPVRYDHEDFETPRSLELQPILELFFEFESEKFWKQIWVDLYQKCPVDFICNQICGYLEQSGDWNRRNDLSDVEVTSSDEEEFSNNTPRDQSSEYCRIEEEADHTD